MARSPTHNLPAQISTFVGREDESNQVRALLRTARLLTLSGAGGIGKTRLALEVATGVVESYADGVWLVEVGPVGDPAFVPQAVASALGLLEEVGRPLIETLQRRLRDANCLILLDNCEHLVNAAATLADRLLRACPAVQILATSREPLGLRGETVWRVPPLGLPNIVAPVPSATTSQSAAERLFIARAEAAQPGFDASGDNAATIRSICKRLDGIPLAIELAAAWVALLSPGQLLGRLDDSAGVLRGADRATPARHLTMAAAIQWSYDLLVADERRLFARLSIFASSFTLEAAEFVSSGPPIEDMVSLDLLRRLVTKSLIVVESTRGSDARYRMLEPLRDFGRARLRQMGEERELRQRHAAFYVALGRRSNLVLLSGAGGPWLEPLARHHDNLHAAMRWLLEDDQVEHGQQVGTAVAEVWRQRGHLGEARVLVSQLLSLSGTDEESASRAGLLLLAGQLASFQGDMVSARVLLEESVALCRSLDLTPGLCRALGRLAEVERAQGRYDVSRSTVEAALQAAARTDDSAARRGFQASGTLWRALLDVDECKYAEAEARVQKILPLLEADGWTRVTAHALLVLGRCAAQRGALGEARRHIDQSLAKWAQSDRWGVAWALLEQARLSLTEGHYEQAMVRLAQSLALSRDLGDHWSAAAALDMRAVLAARAGQPELAVRIAEAAVAVRDRAHIVQSPRERAWLFDQIGSLERSLPRGKYLAERQAGRAMTFAQIFDLVLGRERADEGPPALTAREREVARLLSSGCSDARIAESLVISRRTAEVHVRNILAKLGLTSRAQIAVWAVDHGLRQTQIDSQTSTLADRFT